MSDLTPTERQRLERLLRMSDGYVLDFSNRTLDDFFQASIQRSIYDEKYDYGSGSKANRMRGFWKEEKNPLVARLLTDLLDHVECDHDHADPTLLKLCREATMRLRDSVSSADADTIAQIGAEHDLDVVATSILETINRGDFEVGLDRLHTFTTGYLRALCTRHGLTSERGKPLHSVYGELVRRLHDDGHIQSRMTASILKALRGPLEAFNHVRNNQSLAHDNPLLNRSEAILVFRHVTTAVRFLKELDKRIQESKRREASPPDNRANVDKFDRDLPT